MCKDSMFTERDLLQKDIGGGLAAVTEHEIFNHAHGSFNGISNNEMEITRQSKQWSTYSQDLSDRHLYNMYIPSKILKENNNRAPSRLNDTENQATKRDRTERESG
ncbi:hypothetical protein CROQUDRAFT_108106 [Cronartium quercuum f. sp. fusiforme G11]|uniref:Uncharacterized protein n=1 Tax=Cronartium quercuum f. sp. fusiforme G11 TaxID=708437 RepID=A0A9P6TAW4_9BASI|nr:hypothetical protein CROQUDRAFT_108106 [Cronartium quercuum f. sp. fusiforme G11]